MLLNMFVLMRLTPIGIIMNGGWVPSEIHILSCAEEVPPCKSFSTTKAALITQGSQQYSNTKLSPQ